MPVQKAFCIPFWRRHIRTRIFVPHFATQIQGMYISASKGGVQKKFALPIWDLMQQTGGHGWVIAPPEAVTPGPPAKVETMPAATSKTAPVQKKKKASNEIPN